ncbi:hypothetical protein RFI_30786 [Reticulomyxa filosa]|uniref:Uncharacterized protein n=1 Tax=Reticulomyxa filosa TaxID=46433 RepID=X6LXC5_RETFI|nr:hypothetical protein RFI_30786 [Reticulomyxa filosa]|eukprot:ETO06603.1 hypothetical protein RFI_30786 [Reticulomyxa filosa]
MVISLLYAFPNQSASGTVLDEFNARTGDLRRLNELFYKPVTKRSVNESESDTEKANDTRHELLDEVISRNNDFLFSLQKLASPNFFSDQRELQQVVSSNQQWQDEIFKMVHIVAFVKREMLTEMKDRTEDLQTAISVLKNEKPATELDRIVSKNKQRHDAIQQALEELNRIIAESERNRTETFAPTPEPTPNADAAATEEKAAVVNDMQIKLTHENKAWEESIQHLQNVPTRVASSAISADFAPVVSQILVDELASRVTDLEASKVNQILPTVPMQVTLLLHNNKCLWRMPNKDISKWPIS